ncbi:NAD(P)H-hydrate epimerase [Streptomyces flaveolus]|uniref:NAD(P)H-hydrate epimerase n=1 Tax=Streptomyces flaveolus TaxID=67297 RepID=UPI0036F7DF18
MTTTQSGSTVRSGSPDSAVDRVADFYGAYIDALFDGTDDLGEQLCAHYLTDDLRGRLSAWEETNHADGVLRAQDVPSGWEVASGDSAGGSVSATVTLTWGAGASTSRLVVQIDASAQRISGIEDGA